MSLIGEIKRTSIDDSLVSLSDPEAQTDTRDSSGWSSRRCLLAALGIGLVVGWLELAELLLIRWVDPRVTMESLRTNRHFLWMIPVANLVLFSLVGLILAGVGRYRPVLARGLLWPISVGLGTLALARGIEGLHGIAGLALACGVGFRFGPIIERRLPTRRVRPLGLLAVALLILTGVEAWRVETAERRTLAQLPPASKGAPNVMLVVLDNVRASSLSLYGRSRPTTPNLERLARRGVRFDRARSTSSWTLPSHASMMTGRWCHELAFDFNLPLDQAQPTLAETLASHGYHTAGFVGNTYYGNARYGLNRGFARYEDHYENLEVNPFEIIRSAELGKCLLSAFGCPIRVEEDASLRKSAAMINRDVLTWLDDRPGDRPFFAFLNYFDAHAPFITPDDSAPRFGYALLPQAERAEIVLKEVRLKADSGISIQEAERIRQEANASRLDSYESCIASLDQQIGQLFDELERRGLLENTVVVLTSDHGEHFAERGFYGHGLSLYEPEIHVPLLVFSPRKETEGKVVEEPVSLRDAGATILDLVGLDHRTEFPGESLAKYWQSELILPDTPLLAELGQRKNLTPTPAIPTSMGPVKAVVKGYHVFILNGDGREELFELKSDPRQRSNLIEARSESTTAESLRSTLESILSGNQPSAPPRAGQPSSGLASDRD